MAMDSSFNSYGMCLVQVCAISLNTNGGWCRGSHDFADCLQELSSAPCHHRAPRRYLPFRPSGTRRQRLRLCSLPHLFQENVSATQQLPWPVALRLSWRIVGSPPLRASSGLVAQSASASSIMCSVPTVRQSRDTRAEAAHAGLLLRLGLSQGFHLPSHLALAFPWRSESKELMGLLRILMLGAGHAARRAEARLKSPPETSHANAFFYQRLALDMGSRPHKDCGCSRATVA